MGYKILIGKKIPLRKFLSILKLDEKTFSSEYHISLIKGARWVIRNRLGYIAAFNENNEVIGYVSMVSLKKKYFDMLKNGEIVDSKLPIKSFKKLNSHGVHYIYFSSIVVDEKYRTSMVALDLLKNAEELLLKFSESGSITKYILIDAVSESGKLLTNMYHGKECINTKRGTTIYLVDLCDSSIKYSSDTMNKLAKFSCCCL